MLKEKREKKQIGINQWLNHPSADFVTVKRTFSTPFCILSV